MKPESNLKRTELPGYGEISYSDEGTGPVTLLFIHGLGSLIQVWEHNIPDLKKKFRCIALDLPGHGQSAKSAKKYGIYYYAECVAALIQKLGLQNCIPVGHSMGGQIAVVLSVRYPALIDKLVLVAPAGFEKFTTSEIQMMKNYWSMMDMANASSWQLQAGMKSNFHSWSPSADRITQAMTAAMDKGGSREYLKMMQLSMWGMLDEPVFDILKQISVPVLVMFGENDALIPNTFIHRQTTADVAREAVKQFRDAKLLLIADCGHYLQYEKPAIFNQAIKDFGLSE